MSTSNPGPILAEEPLLLATTARPSAEGFLGDLWDLPRGSFEAGLLESPFLPGGSKWALTPALRSFATIVAGLSANHGSVVSCVGLATASLGPELGNLSNGSLFLSYTLSAMLGLGIFMVRWLGPKNAMAASLLCNCLYVGAFIAAESLEDIALKRAATIGGAIVGGLASTVLFTSLGTCLSLSASKHAAEQRVSEDDANSVFGGIFASVYLSLEVATQLASRT